MTTSLSTKSTVSIFANEKEYKPEELEIEGEVEPPPAEEVLDRNQTSAFLDQILTDLNREIITTVIQPNEKWRKVYMTQLIKHREKYVVLGLNLNSPTVNHNRPYGKLTLTLTVDAWFWEMIDDKFTQTYFDYIADKVVGKTLTPYVRKEKATPVHIKSLSYHGTTDDSDNSVGFGSAASEIYIQLVVNPSGRMKQTPQEAFNAEKARGEEETKRYEEVKDIKTPDYFDEEKEKEWLKENA